MLNGIRKLSDAELLSSTRTLVDRERAITIEVLRHLAEIERRKLYCDLRCGSLFDYAVRELKYSEAAASRRIQAMHLMKEIPEIEEKIESGTLTLSNISQAQTHFRNLKRAEPDRAICREEKVDVLARLEEKSSREGERILLSMSPPNVLPRERERAATPELTEIKFLIDQELKAKLEEVRSLLGPKGHGLTMAELVLEMAKLSSDRLQEKRFGKARVAQTKTKSVELAPTPTVSATRHSDSFRLDSAQVPNPGAGVGPTWRSRYISTETKYQIWKDTEGKCSSCGSTHQLQYDHIRPLALGGDSSPENIQLLCKSCNLRRGVRTYGARVMRRA